MSIIPVSKLFQTSFKDATKTYLTHHNPAFLPSQVVYGGVGYTWFSGGLVSELP